MKKLIFIALFSIGSLTTFAQETENEEQQIQATEVAETQDSFSEIAINDLPSAVTEAVKTNYPAATISKAYSNDEKQYKLDVSIEGGESSTLYFDKEGNAIDM